MKVPFWLDAHKLERNEVLERVGLEVVKQVAEENCAPSSEATINSDFSHHGNSCPIAGQQYAVLLFKLRIKWGLHVATILLVSHKSLDHWPPRFCLRSWVAYVNFGQLTNHSRSPGISSL